MVDAASLGRRIRFWRQRRGWTQVRLAEAADVAQAQVSYWESGHRLPGLPEIEAVSRQLRVPVSVLVDGRAQLSGPLVSELEWYGVPVAGADDRTLWAVRPPEVVLIEFLRQPSPRIVDRLAVLPILNNLSVERLLGAARAAGVAARLGWLLDVTSSLVRQGLGTADWPIPRLDPVAVGVSAWDSLGFEAEDREQLGPEWKRWKISYGRSLSELREVVTEALKEAERGR